jgi:hypothetical protein
MSNTQRSVKTVTSQKAQVFTDGQSVKVPLRHIHASHQSLVKSLKGWVYGTVDMRDPEKDGFVSLFVSRSDGFPQPIRVNKLYIVTF